MKGKEYMNYPKWIDDLFEAIDAKDLDKFASYLTEDSEFIYGNFPAISGKNPTRDFVSNFLGSISRTKHQIENYMESGSKIIINGTVCYTRLDGSLYEVKFCNIFDMSGNFIKKYDIFIDSSNLYSSGS